MSGHAAPIAESVFCSNAHVVALDRNGQIRRWDLNSHEEDQSRRRDLPGGPTALVHVMSPKGRLAALAEGNKVRVFDTSTGKQMFQLDSANPFYRRLIFSRTKASWLLLTTQFGGAIP